MCKRKVIHQLSRKKQRINPEYPCQKRIKNQTIQHVGLFGNSWKMEDDLPDIYRELEKRQDR